MSREKNIFWLKTKPFSPQEAVKRIKITTGTFKQAMLHENSKINGHSYSLSWNEYRQYYILEYNWAGRKVLRRSTDFKSILKYAIEVYAKTGKGSNLIVRPNQESLKDISVCENTEVLEPWSFEIQDKWFDTWYTKEHNKLVTEYHVNTITDRIKNPVYI